MVHANVKRATARRRWTSLVGALISLGCAEQSPPSTCELDEDCSPATLCVLGRCTLHEGRRPYRDAWREELVLPADQFERLRIGGTLVDEHFANRGDIELRYVDGQAEIVVEVQRFTVARNLADAEAAFERMKLWAYSLETPQVPDDELDDLRCEQAGADFCHLRNWYEGQIQPVRDGVNFRVSLPAGWDGELQLETEDNLAEDDYPDRGDIHVDGLAGSLRAVVDSGRVHVRLADAFPHFPGCELDQACVAADLAPDCGCDEFARLQISARTAEAADIVVDVPAQHSYVAQLQNADLQLEAGCVVELDCDAFAGCVVDPDSIGEPALVRAVINHPGEPAPSGAGIRIELLSGWCEELDHAEQPSDAIIGAATELRGNVRLCSGCL